MRLTSHFTLVKKSGHKDTYSWKYWRKRVGGAKIMPFSPMFKKGKFLHDKDWLLEVCFAQYVKGRFHEEKVATFLENKIISFGFLSGKVNSYPMLKDLGLRNFHSLLLKTSSGSNNIALNSETRQQKSFGEVYQNNSLQIYFAYRSAKLHFRHLKEKKDLHKQSEICQTFVDDMFTHKNFHFVSTPIFPFLSFPLLRLRKR